MPPFGLFGPPNIEELKTKSDVKGLIEALSYEKDVKVRRDAAKALGQVGDARAVEPLITALKGVDVLIRRAVIEALGQLGDVRVVEPLITALKDDDDDVRPLAEEMLTKIGTPAVELLITTLNDDKDYEEGLREAKLRWDRREAIALILGRIKDPRAIEPLIAALEQRYNSITDYDRFERFTGYDRFERLRTLAVDALVEIGDARAVEPLLMGGWADALAKMGVPAVEHLITALENDSSYVREGAAEALGRIGDARAVVPLVAALHDKDIDVQAASVDALRKLDPARVVEPQIELHITALKDSDSNVRKAAAEALGKLRDARAVELLVATLKDSDSNVRKAAAEALGRIGDARAVEPLVATLEDSHGYVRDAAAKALRNLGHAPTRPASMVSSRVEGLYPENLLSDEETWELARTTNKLLEVYNKAAALVLYEKKFVDGGPEKANSKAMDEFKWNFDLLLKKAGITYPFPDDFDKDTKKKMRRIIADMALILFNEHLKDGRLFDMIHKYNSKFSIDFYEFPDVLDLHGGIVSSGRYFEMYNRMSEAPDMQLRFMHKITGTHFRAIGVDYDEIDNAQEFNTDINPWWAYYSGATHVHELGHAVRALLFGFDVKMTVTRETGLVNVFPGEKRYTAAHVRAIAFAGPLANLLFVLLAGGTLLALHSAFDLGNRVPALALWATYALVVAFPNLALFSGNLFGSDGAMAQEVYSNLKNAA